MHITLLTIGSRGDVQPFIALGRSLRLKGIHVRLATHERFRPLAERHQLDFAPIHSDPLALLQTPAGQAWIQSGKNSLSLVTNMVRLGRPVFQQLITDAAEACKNTDLIVYTIFGSVAYHIAEKQGIPAIMASLQPLLNPREAFPVPGSPKLFTRTPWLHRLYNRTSYQAAQQIFWQPFRPLVQKWRRKTLSLPRASFFGPYRQLRHNKIPFLEAYSPTVVPPPATWPDWYHTTGYWQLPPSAEWEPPADLQAFLAADSPFLSISALVVWPIKRRKNFSISSKPH